MAHAGSLVDKPQYGKEQNHSFSLSKFFDNKALALIIFSMFFILAPLDAAEVFMALAGAVVYALLKVLPKMTHSKKSQTAKRPLKSAPPKDVCNAPRRSNCKPLGCGSCAAARQPTMQPATIVSDQAIRRPYKYLPSQKRSVTAVPIAAPVFKVSDFDSQVSELVAQLMPTPDSEKAVADIARLVKKAIQPLFPDLDVCGFACGSLGASAAFGVAVPEVDIVVNANPAELIARLHGLPSWAHSGHHNRGRGVSGRETNLSKLDKSKLQKSTIRECTSLLMKAGFKFRRSCFRSASPKVTVMVPSALGICSESVPCDFSVNNTTPFYNMALWTECGHIDLRAKELLLLVKRWTKDRGICHASKGHLPPYAWTLLVIYFLQVGDLDEGALLPPLEDFVVVSGLMAKRQKRPMQIPKAPRPKAQVDRAHGNSVGDLFKKFVKFYTEKMNWHKEAVAVRLAKRAAPNLDLEIHVVVNEDGSTLVSPIIEDPFNTKHNLGGDTNVVTLKRFYDEFDRAKDLMAKDEPLSTLLELWRPPDAEGKANGEEGPHDEPNE
mmetsp:Transcript_139754/g.243391  ORF Transcript_139754/g.243391 Transcript_139754/m.243391 type:complete len:551 (-) Transcript_139754:141-1793(-)